MNITPFTIYLIPTLNSLKGFFTASAIITFIIVCITVIGATINCEELSDRNKSILSKIIRSLIIWLFFSIIGSVFIPSDKTLISMYTIPTVLNNQQVKQLPENILKFINNYLEKMSSDKKYNNQNK